MQTLFHNLIWLISVLAVLYVGYWGLSQLITDAPEDYVREVVVEEPVHIETPVTVTVVEEEVEEAPEFLEEEFTNNGEEETKEVNPEYTSLIAELEKLSTDRIFMKVGSQGTRVGTIQNFLNIYNDSSSRVDNDYGGGTKAKVLAFQKDVGITADGETGPQTYQKMVQWLQEN